MSYNEAFESLLFGSGNLIGLMLLVTINIVLMGIQNKGKVLVIPINLLFAYEYMKHGQDFAWHMIIMLILCMFNLISMIYPRKK